MKILNMQNILKIDKAVAMLIYGQPGIGKTSLANTLENLLFVDLDFGLERSEINLTNDLAILQPNSYKELIDDLTSSEFQELGFKAICIDTIENLLHLMSLQVIADNPKCGKSDGSLGLNGYGARKIMFQNFLKTCKRLNVHLLFLAHEEEVKNGEKTEKRPKVGGSSCGDLLQMLDLVGYYSKVSGKNRLSFNPSDEFYGKNCLSNIEDGELVIEKRNLVKGFLKKQTIDKYQEKINANIEDAIDYQQLLNNYIERINKLKSLEDLNSFFEIIQAELSKPIGNLKTEVWNLLQSKALEGGFGWEKDTKKFILVVADEPQVEEKIKTPKSSKKEASNDK